MVRLLEEFSARCRAGGVRTLNEGGLSPAAYYDAVKRFIDVQVEGNLAFRKPVAAEPPPAPKYARGDLAVLTNGVRGASDFKVHWLGWEGVDFTLTLDLGQPVAAREIALSTLSDFRSWILHPESVDLLGLRRRRLVPRGRGQGPRPATTGRGRSSALSPGRRTWPIRASLAAVRYVRFRIEGTKRLPDWHASAGGLSWVFVDEIVVR